MTMCLKSSFHVTRWGLRPYRNLPNVIHVRQEVPLVIFVVLGLGLFNRYSGQNLLLDGFVSQNIYVQLH